jgi:SAM-dependent methyltransferase
MKLDRLIQTKLLGRPYRGSERRFEEEKKAILASAAVVVDRVLEIMPVRSVVDVGCNVGLWLSVFAARGAERVVGIDGDYTDRSRLAIDPSCFIAQNLNEPLSVSKLGKFDLAMSLEVGEHLLPERADSLVDDLCGLSDVVMYGAAIEQQGGEQHRNEQWQSYWVGKFKSRGYLPYDVLRPAIWDHPDVFYWYKQNTIFYVREGSAAHVRFEQRFPNGSSTKMLNVIHPDLFEHHLNTKRGVRRLAKNLRRIFLGRRASAANR